MISYKENLHKFYRHECPDFIPDMRRDFSRVNYAFGKYEAHPPMGENGYDGYVTVEFEGMEDNLKGIELGLANLKRFIG